MIAAVTRADVMMQEQIRNDVSRGDVEQGREVKRSIVEEEQGKISTTIILSIYILILYLFYYLYFVRNFG